MDLKITTPDGKETVHTQLSVEQAKAVLDRAHIDDAAWAGLKTQADRETAQKIMEALEPLTTEQQRTVLKEAAAKYGLRGPDGVAYQAGRQLGEIEGFAQALNAQRNGTATREPNVGPSLDEFMSAHTSIAPVELEPNLQQLIDTHHEIAQTRGGHTGAAERLDDFLAGSNPTGGIRVHTKMTAAEMERWVASMRRASELPEELFNDDGKPPAPDSVASVLAGRMAGSDDAIAEAVWHAKDIYGSVERMDSEIDDIESEAALKAEIEDWLSKPFVMQKPQGSAWYKVLDAARERRVYTLKPNGSGLGRAKLRGFDGEGRVFVVEHDWAQAFEGAKDYDDSEVRLPFPFCVFEFRLSGRRVLGTIDEDRAGVLFVSASNDRWVALGPPHTDGPLRELVSKQVAAICVALDAQVAVTQVERAPAKLNQARAKKGLSPLKDYHVVSLTRRARSPHPRGDGESGRKVRLHFRRGHWRHYGEDAATCTHAWGDPDPSGRRYCRNDCGMWRSWINWMLCGNPDLGFIDKHYKL